MQHNMDHTAPAWRQFAVALAVAIGSAMLGVSAAPQPAQAVESTELTTWTCSGTDRCHDGEQECCDDPDTMDGLTHCTTVESGTCGPNQT